VESLKLKFQTVAEKTEKNFSGLLYFAAPGTLCLKKAPNLKFVTMYLKIVWIDFDGIWQKYSKYCRIEFVCFS